MATDAREVGTDASRIVYLERLNELEVYLLEEEERAGPLVMEGDGLIGCAGGVAARTTRRHASRAVPQTGHAGVRACLEKERMMGITDFLSWLLVGLLAGGLASALTPGRTPGGALGVIGIGVLGGWGWALLFGSGPTTFLGSVIVGVLGAMAILYLLRRLDRPRYRI